MPKFPTRFGRRKSTANAFEDVQPNQQSLGGSVSSFKVFERPSEAAGGASFDGGVKLAKTGGGHLYPGGRPKTAQRDTENMFEGIVNGNRGSGGSNSNTASTADNSSRLSAASTAPSSTDTRSEEFKAGNDKPHSDIPIPPIPKSQSAFSLKAAGRSLSWGRTKTSTPPPPVAAVKQTPKAMPSPPLADEFEPRARAVTGSSYASTATPPKLDEKDLGLSLGGDFSTMFGGFGKRKSVLQEVENNRNMSRSPESSPAGPASRPRRATHLSPLEVDRNKQIEPSQYSWSSQHSRDGLMGGSTPPPFAPGHTPSPPPVPQHTSPMARKDFGSPPSTRRPGIVDAGLRRNSAYSGRRLSTLDMDDDAKLLKESLAASRKLNEPSYGSNVRDSWALPSSSNHKVDNASVASWTPSETTPRPRKVQQYVDRDESLFDDTTAHTAHAALRFADSAPSPPVTQQAPQTKVMTPAQFERYRQDQERMRSVGGHSKDDEDEDDDDEPYDDEEEEMEKNRQIARQRRKQEAQMAVYRQQMMKVAGETPSNSASPTSAEPGRPQMYSAHSTPNLMNLGMPAEDEEEDEEVPLAILQAHGFPTKGKPQMRPSGSNPNLRAQAMSNGALPVFARHLPQDPYYGAGLQNPMHRESMAFGAGAGSVSGGSPRAGPPPGGLVGVIAGEERARAMRRGSPNSQGQFGAPVGGYDGMGMMHGSPSMMNLGGMGGMNPMMMNPGDPAQAQMNQQMQQMQQFMQVQMHFMQMMSQGQGQQPNGQMPMGPNELQRPSSAHAGAPQLQLRPGSNHQRAMTMMDPNSAPWMNGGGFGSTPSMSGGLGLGGYAPSIAPSERSNVGLPGRYRPVSTAVPIDNKSRTSTMASGALQGWENRNGQSTIKAVPKKSGMANVSDEDDDEGWEQMKKAKEKKKSIWRTKKTNKDLMT